jgi:hypothetical protein
MRLPEQVARYAVVFQNRNESVPGTSRQTQQGRIQIERYELV